MKKIQLTQGKVALVDDEDFDRLNQNKWHYNGRYAVRNSKPNRGEKRFTIYMQDEVIDCPDGYEVDHKDCEADDYGLNNQRSNLRVCTHSQNAMNRMVSSANAGRYKGVGYVRRTGKYRARIQINGKETTLGTFADEKSAAAAYNEAALLNYGEFAWLNTIL